MSEATTEKVVSLPRASKRPTTDEQKQFIEQTIDRALAWLKDVPGRSQGDIDNGTKYKRATINRFLCRKYDEGGNYSVAQSVAAFLDREEEESEAHIDLDPVQFPAWVTVQSALRACKAEKGFGIIHGEPGQGKTFAAQHFAEQDPDHDLVIMTTAATKTLQGFLAKLRAKLAKSKQITYSRIERMADTVIEQLILTPRFVIVNEGQRCNFDIFDFACDIQEQAHCGVAFVGHSLMMERIRSEERKDSETYDRVYSRCDETLVERETNKLKVTPELVGQLVRQILPDATDRALEMFACARLFPRIRDIALTAEKANTMRRLSHRKGPMNEEQIFKALCARRPLTTQAEVEIATREEARKRGQQ